jgi:hypothetical protein
MNTTYNPVTKKTIAAEPVAVAVGDRVAFNTSNRSLPAYVVGVVVEVYCHKRYGRVIAIRPDFAPSSLIRGIAIDHLTVKVIGK